MALDVPACVLIVGDDEQPWSHRHALQHDNEIDDGTMARLSSAVWEHVNPYGWMQFDVETVLGQTELRPLREPE